MPSTNPLLQTFLLEVPEVWTERNPITVHHRTPITVQLKVGVNPVHIRQCPMPREACVGITSHMNWLWEARILGPYQSAWNTHLFPIEKLHCCDF